MQDANNWIDIIKKFRNFRSDYELAKYWNVSTSEISQYRRGKLRIPMAFLLEIAIVGNYHPLEVILSLEWPRAKDGHREIIKDIYWEAMMPNADRRMGAYFYSRKCYKRRHWH